VDSLIETEALNDDDNEFDTDWLVDTEALTDAETEVETD